MCCIAESRAKGTRVSLSPPDMFRASEVTDRLCSRQRANSLSVSLAMCGLKLPNETHSTHLQQGSYKFSQAEKNFNEYYTYN
jgi:hypothetical protein